MVGIGAETELICFGQIQGPAGGFAPILPQFDRITIPVVRGLNCGAGKMYDPNLADFYRRVAQYETSQARGFAHEAPGTLGRSVTHGLRKARRRPKVMPLIFVTVAAIGLKAVMLHHVGDAVYQDRVARLQAGQGFDRLGGWFMQVDPVTAYLADQLATINPG